MFTPEEESGRGLTEGIQPIDEPAYIEVASE